MSSILKHAIKELEYIGYKSPNHHDYNEMNNSMGDNVLELLTVFANQGHSGFSASYCLAIFEKLAKFEPLGPLTGEDSEWNDVSEMNGSPMWQNNRASHVFKDADGRTYDIRGKIFREPDGNCYTGKGSSVDVTFPYTPKSEYVDVNTRL